MVLIVTALGLFNDDRAQLWLARDPRLLVRDWFLAEQSQRVRSTRDYIRYLLTMHYYISFHSTQNYLPDLGYIYRHFYSTMNIVFIDCYCLFSTIYNKYQQLNILLYSFNILLVLNTVHDFILNINILLSFSAEVNLK